MPGLQCNLKSSPCSYICSAIYLFTTYIHAYIYCNAIAFICIDDMCQPDTATCVTEVSTNICLLLSHEFTINENLMYFS